MAPKKETKPKKNLEEKIEDSEAKKTDELEAENAKLAKDAKKARDEKEEAPKYEPRNVVLNGQKVLIVGETEKVVHGKPYLEFLTGDGITYFVEECEGGFKTV